MKNLLLLAALLLLGLRTQADPTRERIVVAVSALAEWNTAKAALKPARIENTPLGETFVQAMRLPDGRTVKLRWFHSGQGKTASAASAQYIISTYRPTILLNAGTCGGFEGRTRPGDLIIGTKTLMYDVRDLMGDSTKYAQQFETTYDWQRFKPLESDSLYFGVFVTADADLDPRLMTWLEQCCQGRAAEWESAALGWVCRRHGVKPYVVRGVSDVVHRQGGSATYGNYSEFEKGTDVAVRKLVARLPQIVALL